MDTSRQRNDLSQATTRFCLALEEHRRTPEGRSRTPQHFLSHFFPHDDAKYTDRIFSFMPNDVRGPIVSAWGIRGAKAALRDSDEKIATVVYDALLAGDLVANQFEEGVNASTIVGWAPLDDWWSFWRAGVLPKAAIMQALVTASDLRLFEAKWLWESLEAKGLKGTQVVSDGLSKEELAQWVHKIHESGDGSPGGLLDAIGWERLVQKTSNDVLCALLDALAVKVGLAKATPAEPTPPEVKPEPPKGKEKDKDKEKEKPFVSEKPSVTEFGAPVRESVRAELARRSHPSLPSPSATPAPTRTSQIPPPPGTGRASVPPPARDRDRNMLNEQTLADTATAIAEPTARKMPDLYEEDKDETHTTHRYTRRSGQNSAD